MVSRQQSTTVGMLTSAGVWGGRQGGADGGWIGVEGPGLVKVGSNVGILCLLLKLPKMDLSLPQSGSARKRTKAGRADGRDEGAVHSGACDTLCVRGSVMFSNLS